MTGTNKPLNKPCRISLRLTPDQRRIIDQLGGPQVAFDKLLKLSICSCFDPEDCEASKPQYQCRHRQNEKELN